MSRGDDLQELLARPELELSPGEAAAVAVLDGIVADHLAIRELLLPVAIRCGCGDCRGCLAAEVLRLLDGS